MQYLRELDQRGRVGESNRKIQMDEILQQREPRFNSYKEQDPLLHAEVPLPQNNDVEDEIREQEQYRQEYNRDLEDLQTGLEAVKNQLARCMENDNS